MEKEKYRFDDAYSAVYEYDGDSNAYIYIGSYLAYGLDASMTEEKMIEAMER